MSVLMEIVGDPETGKTRFCANALAECDSKGVLIAHHSAVGDTEAKAAIEMKKCGNVHLKIINSMQDFRDFVQYCLSEPSVRVVCIDSGSDLRNFAENEFLSENPELKRVYPLVLYGRVFSKIDDQVIRLTKGGKHVVFTGRVKDEFEDEVRTGRRIRDSYKKLPFQLPMILHFQYGIRDDNGKVWFRNHIFAEVLKNSFWKKFREKEGDKIGKPWVFDVSFEGVINELVVNPWDGKNIVWSAHEWLHANGIAHDEAGTQLLKEK
jgi:hypothetical protein